MRVSLAFRPQNTDPVLDGPPPLSLCDPAGPRIVLGERPPGDGLAVPIAPRRHTLFGPRGAIRNPLTGAVAVADTGHHRLLIWHKPRADHCPADLQIGQRDFESEGRNGNRDPSAASLNVPTGLATDGRALAVADAWNHRVLIWKNWPETDNQPADLVLGQRDFKDTAANRGGEPDAVTLNWCYGVSFVDGGLAVADTGNRRVLWWDQLPTRNGQPADLVLGQRDFDSRDENAGLDAGALGMRWPHAIASRGPMLLVADAGDNRIMVWNRRPERPGTPCDFVLGQAKFSEVEHNRGRYLPDRNALNMPYGLTIASEWLVAADTANSRLVGWPADTLAMDAPARALLGQPDFGSKGDNRWQMPVRDSLCWPYGVTSDDAALMIADSGNNRVLLWDLAP
ncbi:MAG: hypothetical protein R3D05_00745 [Dongiaceae bacterium]